MSLSKIKHVRAFVVRGGGADYHDQGEGHWIDDHIATPMSKYPEYRQSRRTFGINVPRMMTLTYGAGVGLAALGGVLAAPIYSVNPQMGSNLIIVVFAVVVIGGMGSILGAVLTGFGLGVIEGLTKVFYAEASSTVVFIIMAIVLLIRPAGLFGKEK